MPCRNPWVERVPPAVHGSASSNRIQVEYDFSQNLNPLGPPPGIMDDLRDALSDAVRYPSLNGRLAAESLANWLGVDPEWVAVGNGSSELIFLVALAFLSSGRSAVVLSPSYLEYERATIAVGARVFRYRLNEAQCFQWDPAKLQAIVRRSNALVVWLGNPHNPTGQSIDLDAMRYLLRHSRDTLWVVDEAYAELSNCQSTLQTIGHRNVVVMRSLTKALGLPGVRLGYAVAHPTVIDSLLRVSQPWNLSNVAERLAAVAPHYWGHVLKGAAMVDRIRPWMVHELSALGLEPVPSRANFLMFRVKETEGIAQGLLRRGIMVRDCASLGLPGYLRLAVRPDTEVQVLLARLKEVVK